MIADYHMHTVFSDDSTLPMREAVEQAIHLGLDEICFTEHIDYGVKTDLNCDIDAFQTELRYCQMAYGDKIRIRMGMEFGVQTHTIDQFEETFKQYPFDFIILSIHQVENLEFWKQQFQANRTQQEYNDRYYEELLHVIQKYKNYSVLGHLDLIRRYDKKGNYPFHLVKEKVTQILCQVIADGKGIEINTSSFRYRLGDLMPSRTILSLYRELGGEIITIGSDTHKVEHVAEHFQEVRDTLKELGFKHFYTFDQMHPIQHVL